MRKTSRFLVPMLLLAPWAFGQRPPEAGGCKNVSGTISGIRCPYPGCGETYSVLVDSECNDGSPCNQLLPVSTCCGKGGSFMDTGDPCLITELRSPIRQQRIIELARDWQVLVPTCGGAYVPASIALRRGQREEQWSPVELP
jgi:hypothetical protein